MQVVEFNGWDRNVRLANGEVELIVTQDIGPRVMRFGFLGERNVFAEIEGHQGGVEEEDWMLRGGHRLWLAPEAVPLTYELDNTPIRVEAIPDGVRAAQPPGAISHVAKTMDITLAPDANEVRVVHTLRNHGGKPIRLAPWALSVMAPEGMAVIPLPAKIPHGERLTHNQVWSLWPYTDLADARWRLGTRYVFLRQDRQKGATKIGIDHREGWVAYMLGEYLFVKRFDRMENAVYPDGGVNFETFTNEDFLELESLGPLVDLAPGASVSHEEQWELYRNLPRAQTEEEVDRFILPAIA
jgi:hypothetical protein